MSNQKDIGGIWVKNNQNGEYLSISVELDGKKYNFAAFKSRYKSEGDNKPTYYIPAIRDASQNNTIDKADSYQARVDFVNTEKAKLQQAKSVSSAITEQAGPDQNSFVTETDVPF